MRYQFQFEALPGASWVPLDEERREMAHLMGAVAPLTVEWDMGGGGAPVTLTVALDLDGRYPLEALQLVVQALNTVSVFVAGWPAGQQSIIDRPIGGMHSPPLATGVVTCVAMTPL